MLQVGAANLTFSHMAKILPILMSCFPLCEDLEKQICDVLGLIHEQVPMVILSASLPVLQKYEY